MRIAIVGAGISGLTAAWLLDRNHEVVVYDTASHAGGHTHTVSVNRPEGDYEIDTGFIVFNDQTYPNFNRLLEQLGIGRQPTSMGFSVSSRRTGIEFCGAGLGGFFAQRERILAPAHWKLLSEILRFNKRAPALLDEIEGELPLGEYLDMEGYSELFKTHYIYAMGGAIWSCGEAKMAHFPARFFVRFFYNHGLLRLRDRPQWYVIPGGAARYVEAMLDKMDAEVRTETPVTRVRRHDGGVALTVRGQEEVDYDHVILACHSDQALDLLQDPDDDEIRLLGNIPYQENEVVLHTDTRMLPENRRTWSSWNAIVGGERDMPQLTYNMNILQSIEAPVTFCVSLNATDEIEPESIIGQFIFSHPVFTPQGVAARTNIESINGRRNTWFCGAWCRYGFHEDGVVSALSVAEHFGEKL